jgi:hypothetical protein
MKWSINLAFVAALLGGSQSTLAGDKPAPGKQLQVNLRVFEGDPLGSREAGTLKVTAEPRLVTSENRRFTFLDGGEIAVTDGECVEFVQFGRMIEGRTGTVKDGKVRLDVTLSNTILGDRTEERIRTHTESMRTVTSVRLGEVVKIRWGKGRANKQVWVELSVEEIKP